MMNNFFLNKAKETEKERANEKSVNISGSSLIENPKLIPRLMHQHSSNSNLS